MGFVNGFYWGAMTMLGGLCYFYPPLLKQIVLYLNIAWLYIQAYANQ